MTKEKNKKEVVIPGEVIAKASEFLPGDWTIKQGEDIRSTRLGIVEKQDRLVKVIPISGVYIPRRGNIVIGEVRDITMNGWIVDIKAPYNAFLLLRECPSFIEESEMENVYGVGDLIITKVLNVRRTTIDVTMKHKEKGLGKVRDGIIITVNPYRVPRVIGKEGSMVKLIKDASRCLITIGQNGLIWIKGETIENELFAKKAIEYVIENTITEGLTDKVGEWLKENKLKGAKQNEKEEGSEEEKE